MPPGRFYLVDAGYTNAPGFLAPYRGVREMDTVVQSNCTAMEANLQETRRLCSAHLADRLAHASQSFGFPPIILIATVWLQIGSVV
ncbi:hypothetical protein AAC387_Pa03g3718 [Persea americana]